MASSVPPEAWHEDGKDPIYGAKDGDNGENHKPCYSKYDSCNVSPPEVKEGVKLSVPHICCQHTHKLPAIYFVCSYMASGTYTCANIKL